MWPDARPVSLRTCVFCEKPITQGADVVYVNDYPVPGKRGPAHPGCAADADRRHERGGDAA